MNGRRQDAQIHAWTASTWCKCTCGDFIYTLPRIRGQLIRENWGSFHALCIASCKVFLKQQLSTCCGTITRAKTRGLVPLRWGFSISGSWGYWRWWGVFQSWNTFPGADLPSVEVDLFCHLQWGPLHVPGAPHNLCANSHDILCVSL